MDAHHVDAHLADFAGQADQCTRCGSCQTVCPVHAVTLTESTCPRGKVHLAREIEANRLTPSKELQEVVFTCLMCKTCLPSCPSGVPTDVLFLRLRRALAVEVGLPLAKRIAFSALTYRRLFDLGLRLGPAFQSLLFKEAPDGRGGRRSRVPLPAAGLNMRRIIPSLASRPLRSLLAKRPRINAPKARVALFPGCMLNYVYPQAGKAIADILAKNGIELLLPQGLGCCGVPALANGDVATAGFLAARNVETLASCECDAIITGCASCGAALRNDYALALEDNSALQAWNALRTKVFDIVQYLAQTGYSRDFKEIKAKVTYHDPCHLARGMGVTAEPRTVIASLPGVDYVEMRNAATCCGCGGTFSLTQYELARKINDKKIDNIEASGAEVLVTGCSACRMHINDGLSRRPGNIRVMHTAELVAMAYGA